MNLCGFAFRSFLLFPLLLRTGVRANLNLKSSMTTKKRIVVKFGTSVLTGGGKQLDQAHMVELVRQCAALYQAGHDVVVCTSGAVAVGRATLDFPALPATIQSKQLLASVGQPRLMLLWDRFFDIYAIRTGQILLTRADVENRRRYLNARDTFGVLLEHRIVPVVNENDAVATEEIRVGDNDNLSALVATLVGADLLLLLTDQEGLFTADPRVDPSAQLIAEVHHIDQSLRKRAGGTSTGLGTGGMATKLQAASIAHQAGADVVIAAGREPNVIMRAATGEAVGTRFPAPENRLESRKQWILAGPRASGRIVVDSGAAAAVLRHGRSLLPAGIVAVEGEFNRGDTVLVVDVAGREVARGLVPYTANDLRTIAGCKSHEIVERLGFGYGSVAMHRNDMILLDE
jgi:glutamate 5-kinase